MNVFEKATKDAKIEGYEELILVKYGELALKGANRSVFEKRLWQQVKRVNADLPDIRIQKEHGRMYIHLNGTPLEPVLERTGRVFGIVGLCPALVVDADFEEIRAGVFLKVRQALAAHPEYQSFKMVARRSNKGFPMDTMMLNRELGGCVLEEFPQLRVDVHTPDLQIYVEVRGRVYIYINQIPGFGGMPYGTAGKGMVLLSGGIDSPVAAWLMAKRGVEIEAVHFHSFPFTSERAADKVTRLAEKLCRFTGEIRLIRINLLEGQQLIREKCPEEEMTILSRCLMMRVATVLAEQRECKALITGESIGQVASQTMEGLTVTTAQTHLPIFRPLIATDKVDIVDYARALDTFDISILPYEDCCTVFLPKRVLTKPPLERIQKSLEKLDVEALVARLVATAEYIHVK